MLADRKMAGAERMGTGTSLATCLGASVECCSEPVPILSSSSASSARKKKIGHQGFVHPAQAIQGQMAKAAAHGIADKQGPCEHGRAHRRSKGHGQIHPPMIRKTSDDQP